jgi:hypothetical protein
LDRGTPTSSDELDGRDGSNPRDYCQPSKDGRRETSEDAEIAARVCNSPPVHLLAGPNVGPDIEENRVGKFVMPRLGERLWVEFSGDSAPGSIPVSYVVVAVERSGMVTARPLGGTLPGVPADTPCRVEFAVGGEPMVVDAVAATCWIEP